MDLFPDRTHVQPQSRKLGTYLYADEDGVGVVTVPAEATEDRGADGGNSMTQGVSLSRRRTSLNAAWLVHRIVHEGVAYVLLHGAAYGRYLTVSPLPDDEAPRGHRGRRVVQSNRDYFDPRAVMRGAIRAWDGGNADDVIVRHYFHHKLRANGRYRRWYTGVTVDDIFAPWSMMMRWTVQAIPPRAAQPDIQLPVATPNVGTRRGLFRRRAVPASEPQWMIWYVLADDDGNVDDHNWDVFMFSGRSVFNLMARVAFREGHTDANHFVLCVKAGHDARRTPLVIDLLPSQVQPISIIALTNGSPGAAGLVYPDVDAEAP